MEIHLDQRLKKLRFFGIRFFFGMGLVFGLGLWQHWPLWALGIPVVLGLGHLTLAIISPRFLSPTHRIFNAIIDTLAGVISLVLLIPVYYLLFSPVSMILRWTKKDPLTKAGGWQDPRPQTNDPAQLQKLF